MGGCQIYGPFLGTEILRRRITIGIQEVAITWTTCNIKRFLSRGGGLGLPVFLLQARVTWNHMVFVEIPAPLNVHKLGPFWLGSASTKVHPQPKDL